VRVHEDLTGRHVGPVAGADAAGNLVVVWYSGVSSGRHVRRLAVDRPPATSGLAAVAVDADAADTTVGLRPAFADERTADADLVYSVAGNTNPALFSAVTVDAAAGTLTLDYAPRRSGSAVLLVRATDASGSWVDAPLSVDVRDTVAPAADIVDVSPDPRNAPVPAVAIAFDEPVTGLDLSDLTLARDGIVLDHAAAGAALATADGGRTWTLSGLSSLTAQAGTYRLTLSAGPARGVRDLNGNLLVVGAADLFTVDTVAPAVAAEPTFDWRSAAQRLVWRFTEDVSASLTKDDLVVTNLVTRQDLPASAIALAYDAQANAATLTFPGFPKGTLPDGRYRVTLKSAGVSDRAGNAVAADRSADVFYMRGDFNHDGRIDVADLGVLASNYGRRAGADLGDGDTDGDGDVDVADLGVLSSAYNKSLPPPVAG